MKVINYLLITTLIASYSIYSQAQNGTHDDVEAVRSIISSKPNDMEKKMKSYYKANRKNPANLVAFGKEFLTVNDTINAKEYAKYALEATNNTFAPAYILLGDIDATNNNIEKAANQYEHAINIEPKEPEAYFKYVALYRKTNPKAAIKKLENLHQLRQDTEASIVIGQIYYELEDFQQSAKAYDKSDINKLKEEDLLNYGMSTYFTKKYNKSLDIAKQGLSNNPRNVIFNRLAFFNSSELGKWEDAITYADALFNKSDSTKLSYYDYAIYGKTLRELKQYDKAIEMYHEALRRIDNARKDVVSIITEQISNAYKANGDLTNAIRYFKQHINNTQSPTFQQYSTLAGLYCQLGMSLTNDAEKIQAYSNADDTYAVIASKFEKADIYCTLMRARVNSYMDPDFTKGLALPFYEKIDQVLGSLDVWDSTDKVRLTEAYRYLMAYYFVKGNNTQIAKNYAQKLLKVDPENKDAKEILLIK